MLATVLTFPLKMVTMIVNFEKIVLQPSPAPELLEIVPTIAYYNLITNFEFEIEKLYACTKTCKKNGAQN